MSEISGEEVHAMVVALDLFEQADAGALAEYLFAETQEQRAALVETYYETLVGQMTGQISDDILARARNLAETAADSLQRSMLKVDIETMGNTIARGIAEGLNPRDIAQDLEMVQGLDSNRARRLDKFVADQAAQGIDGPELARRAERERERLLRDRRETIARTESARAVSEGDMADAMNQGVKYKVWQTTGDDRVSDECQENEAAGPIPIVESFPSGVDTVPAHPLCRCSVSFLSSDEQLKGARERAAARSERTAKAKDEE
jgi:hypothetical protein